MDRKEMKEWLVKELKPVNEEKLIKIYKKYCCFETLSYYKSNYCSCCGKKIEKKLNTDYARLETKIKCKNCGVSLLYTNGTSKTSYNRTKINIALVEHKEGLILERIYEVGYYGHVFKECEMQTLEIARKVYSLDSDLKYHARLNLKGMGSSYYYAIEYEPTSKLKIRQGSEFKRVSEDLYIVNFKIPKYEYLDFKKINEIKTSTVFKSASVNFKSMINAYVENQRMYETFQNVKRYDLLKVFINNSKLAPGLMTMCKNGKKPYDDNFWDYLENLVSNNEDLKNIEVVYPSTKEKYLKKAVEQENKWRRTQDKKRLEEEIKLYDSEYIKRVEKILNINFGDDNYSIKILENVQDFYDTAEVFKNCVYRMGYFKRDSSYIFKIKDNNSNIEELAQVEIENGHASVEQCYAHFNKESKKHNEILKLLKSRLGEIERIICQK